MRPLEDSLQSLELAAVERGAVPPLLLLPLGRPAAWAQALAWGGRSQKRPRETPRTPPGSGPAPLPWARVMAARAQPCSIHKNPNLFRDLLEFGVKPSTFGVLTPG